MLLIYCIACSYDTHLTPDSWYLLNSLTSTYRAPAFLSENELSTHLANPKKIKRNMRNQSVNNLDGASEIADTSLPIMHTTSAFCQRWDGPAESWLEKMSFSLLQTEMVYRYLSSRRPEQSPKHVKVGFGCSSRFLFSIGTFDKYTLHFLKSPRRKHNMLPGR